ncbi:MAG: hypothetical protein ACFFCS_11770 [Candidatus Hodarchaeota archaeon]
MDDGIEISLTNVISPISVDEIPEDYMNYLDRMDFLVDGVAIPDEQKKNIAIIVNEKKFTAKNFTEIVGETLPVGGKLIIFIPVTGINKGKSHEFEVTLKLDEPINLKIERVVN